MISCDVNLLCVNNASAIMHTHNLILFLLILIQWMSKWGWLLFLLMWSILVDYLESYGRKLKYIVYLEFPSFLQNDRIPQMIELSKINSGISQGVSQNVEFLEPNLYLHPFLTFNGKFRWCFRDLYWRFRNICRVNINLI